jgi:hypothetical protein
LIADPFGTAITRGRGGTGLRENGKDDDQFGQQNDKNQGQSLILFRDIPKN